MMPYSLATFVRFEMDISFKSAKFNKLPLVGGRVAVSSSISVLSSGKIGAEATATSTGTSGTEATVPFLFSSLVTVTLRGVRGILYLISQAYLKTLETVILNIYKLFRLVIFEICSAFCRSGLIAKNYLRTLAD